MTLLLFVGFQETKKQSFTEAFLYSASSNFNWLPAVGTAGGILVGFKESLFDIISWQINYFYVAAILRNKTDKFTWRFIDVYGRPYENGKQESVNELHSILTNWDGPTLVGVILI